MVAADTTPTPRLPRAQREQQVVATAHALFAERGYAGVTMDAVAAAVGVTKPLLYAYFGNKEQLYVACIGRSGEALVTAVEDAVAAAPNPGEALKAALRAFFAFVEDDRRAFAVLYGEALPAVGVVAEVVTGCRAQVTATIARAFAALGGGERTDTVLREADALAHGQLAAAEAMCRWWLATGTGPVAAAAELLIDVLEPGLAQRALARRPPTPGAP
jgi:AcrR family transcriptional regulator